MKKETEKLVKGVANLQEDLNSLTVDKINETAVSEPEVEIQLTMKQKAASEHCKYIEPKRSMKALGKLPEKLKAQHSKDWEYVKGIYENYIVSGESVSFWLCLYPGDPDCLWEIPANTPVYVPRMVAKHLEEVQKYHTFDFKEKPIHSWHTDQETHQFQSIGTHYRGKFRAIGAFA